MQPESSESPRRGKAFHAKHTCFPMHKAIKVPRYVQEPCRERAARIDNPGPQIQMLESCRSSAPSSICAFVVVYVCILGGEVDIRILHRRLSPY